MIKPPMRLDCPHCGKEFSAHDPSDKAFASGWNSALEMAAFRLTHDFKQAFGEDTLMSFAVYLKNMKR